MAVARVLFHTFGVLVNMRNTTLYFDARDWGDDIFTEKEKRYLEQMRDRLHEDGELLLKLAWKLHRS